jgi:hypothetical protein
MQSRDRMFLSTIAISFLIAFLITGFSIILIPISADPFGVFDFEDPQVVKIQGLRAHLFETHDAAHKANASEIVMHVNMANEEISQFLDNLTAGEATSASSLDPQELSNALKSVNMQLNEIVTLANTGNMTGVMTRLDSAEQQLDGLV